LDAPVSIYLEKMDGRVKPGHNEAQLLQRHCEEPLRRSNPCFNKTEKRKLDCFVARAPRNDGLQTCV
jgi:hypothetical protein